MSVAPYIRQTALIAVAIIAASFPSAAGEEAAKENPAKEEHQKLKPQATCPIMGGKIDKELYVDANGKRIYVCCKGCVDTVKNDPAAALKKLAELGEEAEDVPSEQKTCPVMGRAINRNLYVEHKGKKLYVCSEACLETVKKDPAQYAKKIAEQIEQDKAKEKAAQENSAAKTGEKETVWTCAMHPEVRQDKPGKCPICAMDLIPAKQDKTESKEPEKETIWTCAMHPQIRKNKPGKCPICGMDLIPAKQNDKAESKEPEKEADSKNMDDIQKDTERQK